MEASLLLSFALPLLIFMVSTWVFLILLYSRLSRKINSMDLREGDEAEIRQKAQQILNKAQMKSLDTLYQSEKKAQQILKDTKVFNTTAEKDLSQQLSKATRQEIEAYIKSLQELQKEITQEFQHISADFSGQAANELKTFREHVTAQAQQSEQGLQTQVRDEFHQAQTQIDQYKKDQLAKIDASMYSITAQVVKQVTGKSLTKTDHESLVMQTLEEAKKSHVFENS